MSLLPEEAPPDGLAHRQIRSAEYKVRHPRPVLRDQRQSSGAASLRLGSGGHEHFGKPIIDRVGRPVVAVVFFGVGMTGDAPILTSAELIPQHTHIPESER